MEFRNRLNIDVETYSDVDLKKCGMYKYSASPNFEILIFAYSLNGGHVEVVDLANGEKLSKDIKALIVDQHCLKIAWNAAFERRTIGRLLGQTLDPAQWECTMVKAAMYGLPMSLDEAGKALNTDTKKALVGKQLIRLFSIPCKPTKANGMRTRNLPEHFSEKWEQYKDYCAQDVYTEIEVGRKIPFEFPAREQQLYVLDQQINDRGVLCDPILINNAIHHSKIYNASLIEECKVLTGLDNPKSVQQLKNWLELEIDESISTLTKDSVHDLLKSSPSQIVTRVLEIRQEISKTSVKKYDAMRNMADAEGRIRGIFQFYGAAKTGRWAGRGIQPQNLYKNNLIDLALLRSLEVRGDFDSIDMCWTTSDALAQLTRTALIAPPGKTLCMSDFSAIEARVLAWLACEQWKIDVFKGHGKIYEATGANMFKVPIEAVTKTSHYRARAKVAELACGYQGGVGALERMGAAKMGMNLAELPDIVGRWRDANKKIVKFWTDVELYATEAVKTGKRLKLRNLQFYVLKDVLFIQLPSGRSLAYQKPFIKTILVVSKDKKKTPWMKETLLYWGIHPKTKQWSEIALYGGLITENIVQATSRDLLCEKMLAVDDAGYLINLHVHDELVVDIEDNDDMVIAVDEVDRLMKAPVTWAEGLPLNADTTLSKFYRKD